MSVNAEEEFYRRFARALSYIVLLLFPPTSPPFDLHKILNYNGLNQDRVLERPHLSLIRARNGETGSSGHIKYLLTLSLYPQI